jgi:DNA-binding NarL/FixJ family response regulator
LVCLEQSILHLLIVEHKQEVIMQVIRVLVVDDNDTFRRRIQEFLASEPDIEVVGEAADGEQAILKARELQPDVALMDVRMPGTNGLDATRQLREEMPELKVIMLSRFDLEEYREAARARGASGYVVKRSVIEELLPAIRQAVGEELDVTTGGGRDDPQAE